MAVARLGFLVQDSPRNGGQSTLAGRYNNIYVNYWTPTNPSNTEPRPNAAQENPDYGGIRGYGDRSEEHTSELQSQSNIVCRLLLEQKKSTYRYLSKTSQIICRN